jgi:tRNA A-37 threonylcarbamoyl transferase component Bud32
MNKPVPDIYRKQFASRYEHAREQQILEYLGQRQGPVPPVVLSHTEDGYLDMHHGGTNLHQWLTASQVNTPTALQVLANALSALISTSQLGVWHIDIALRNFVVQDRGERDAPRVWLIDFGNAICPHFALQKPLWMLPHA